MSASRIWSNFKELLDVSWGSIADGQFLKRTGTSITGASPSGSGDVVGPASAVAGGLPLYSGTTGKLLSDWGAGNQGYTYVDNTGKAISVDPGISFNTATFTCPAFLGTVSISIEAAPRVSIGDKIYIQSVGKFLITAKASNTAVTIYNTGDVGNSSSGTIAIGKAIVLVPTDTEENIVLTYQDHFITGSDGSYTMWTANGTGATKGQGTSTADHPGLYFLTSGTSAGAAATGYAFATAGNGYLYGTGGIGFRAVLLQPTAKPTSTAANLSKIYIGMGTQPANGTYPGADFVGFVFDPSSGMTNAANNWGLLTRKASVSTYTDTGYVFATSTYADLSFYVDATGAYWRAYAWGGTAQAKSAAVTSNVPLSTTPLCPTFFVLNGASGTTSYQTFLDLWEVAYRGNTIVPIFRGSNLIKAF